MQHASARARHGVQVHPARRRPSGVLGSIRYGGVLGVWLGLLVIRPRLALQIFAERRADSPIPRLTNRRTRRAADLLWGAGILAV